MYLLPVMGLGKSVCRAQDYPREIMQQVAADFAGRERTAESPAARR